MKYAIIRKIILGEKVQIDTDQDYNNLDVLALKLLFGADPDIRGRFHVTVLMMCCQYGMEDTTRLLLAYEADVNAKDNDGWTALIFACRYENPSTIKLLLDHGAEIDDIDYNGETALMLSCSEDNEDNARLLIDRGADVNIIDNYGTNALMTASRNSTEEILKLLLERGADIDQFDHIGRTSLIYASLGELDLTEGNVRLLLKHGATRYINTRDNYHETALIYACSHGNHGIAEILLREGAYINVANDDGMTALMLTIRLERESLKEERGSFKQTVKLLLDHKADINLVDNDGRTALSYADQNRDNEIIELLIEHGATE